MKKLPEAQARASLSVVKKLGKLAAVLLLVLLSLIILLLILRQGYRMALKSKHALKEPGIDVVEAAEIGGIQQYLYIRGENIENPVILFLHGGPGSPEVALLHGFQYEWEKHFTIVHWDQRQAGKTYFANDDAAVAPTLSFDRVLQDAWEVTQLVQQKLGKEKILVMGHSWGSILGTVLVQSYPDAFSAYIGVGQVVNLMDNERVGYEMALEKAHAAGSAKDVAALEALQPYPTAEYSEAFSEKMMTLRRVQMKYGLATGMDFNTVMTAATSPYYSLNDLRFYLMDQSVLQKPLLQYMHSYDAHNAGVRYEVPVFYLIGEHDYQTPIQLSRAFFEEIEAPHKAFYTIPNAGHLTMVENKGEFTRVLVEEIAPLVSSV